MEMKNVKMWTEGVAVEYDALIRSETSHPCRLWQHIWRLCLMYT
jgi:hypothetical protein